MATLASLEARIKTLEARVKSLEQPFAVVEEEPAKPIETVKRAAKRERLEPVPSSRFFKSSSHLGSQRRNELLEEARLRSVADSRSQKPKGLRMQVTKKPARK